jgi:putative membrane protein
VDRWGLSVLEDQQLGGLIMWIPAGMVYVGVALGLLVRWLQAADRRHPRGYEERTVAEARAIR